MMANKPETKTTYPNTPEQRATYARMEAFRGMGFVLNDEDIAAVERAALRRERKRQRKEAIEAAKVQPRVRVRSR